MEHIVSEARAPRVQSRPDFFQRLERSLDARYETPAGSVGLFVAHLEAFSLFNDCHGYLAGDRLLEQVAARLARVCAPLSAALRCRIEVGHLHADEFAVLITGLPEEDVARVASRLLSQLGGRFDVADRQVTAQFSLGCAWTAAEDAAAGPLLGEARSAMRRARALGGGRYEIVNDAARKRFALRAHIGRDLHRALQENQLRLVYQPIIDLESSRVEGLEALLRWQHPELGNIPPGDFIPVAAESGQMGELGEWVLARACREFSELQRLPNLADTRFVAINVSRQNLGDRRLPDKVLGALESASLDPAALHLEITESELTSNLESTQVTVRTLRALGVGLAIDDFGVGYSSLASLHDFPVDVLKLDRAFIATDVDTRKGRGLMAVAQATLNLARNMGLRVVAEGVETPAQLALLHSLHCELAQGFLLGWPVAPQALQDYRVPS
jgi:diguanylate cyclase (GGDEF)-like protein